MNVIYSNIGLHTFPRGESFCFILQSLLDFSDKISLFLSRTNALLSKIYVFKKYRIWILGDSWINILCVISSLIYLSITNFSYVME